MSRIIDDVLLLSRLNSDLLIISPEPAMLSTTIRHALGVFEVELKRADIILSLNDDCVEDTLMLFDAGQLLQILVNFMTNAIKFTRNAPKRRITVHVRTSLVKPIEPDIMYIPKKASLRDQTTGPEWGMGEVVYLSLSVTDTGKGLTLEETNRLFDVFSQASPKTHIRYGGSGLGLFISRQLVEMQGGEIGVASEAGRGSKFSCFIKARRTDPPPQALPSTQMVPSFLDVEALREASGGDDSTQAHTRMAISQTVSPRNLPALPLQNVVNDQRLHILVVEDNVINAKLLSKGLRRHGWVVSIANHGVEALDFIRKSEYWTGNNHGEKLSLVLMDLEMPVMDGLTCIRKIGEGQAQGDIRGHIPTIAITANARQDQLTEALGAGMDSVVTKPYRIPDIVGQVEALLTRIGNPNDAR